MKKDTGFYILVVAFLILLFSAYSNHFNNPFEFDDSHTIVNNNAIRSLKNIPTFFTDVRTISILPTNQIYRPGLTTLNAIDYWIGGKTQPKPKYYHISIFLSYVILGVLLYFLFLKLFEETIKHKWNNYFALFGAAFYILHTSNAETINYVIARSDSFSTLMIILCLTIYLYKPEWHNKYIYLIPVIIGFSVKEPTIMILPLLFIYTLLFQKKMSIPNWFSKNGIQTVVSIAIKLLPLIVLAIILVIVSKKMAAPTFHPSATPRLYYVLTQPYVILHYFNNFILPINLSADTDWLPITNFTDYRVLVGSVFILGLIAVTTYCSIKSKLRPIAFGLIWFLLALLPTSVTPLAEVMNDHRTFFPFVGLAIAATWLCCLIVIKMQKQIETKFTVKFGFLFIFLSVITAHAYGVHQRNKVWSSAETLWYDVTIKSPKNGRGLMNYGTQLMHKGDLKNALIYYEKAKVLTPSYPYVYLNLAIVKSAMGDKINAEADFKKALYLDANIPDSYYFYAFWLKSQKRYEEALSMVGNGLLISPEHSLNNLLKKNLIELIKSERNAVQIAEETAKIKPTASNYVKLSLIYYNNGEFEKCIDAASKAIELKPDYAKAYNNICAAQNSLGNFNEAIDAGVKALKLEPDYTLCKNNLKRSLINKRVVDSMLIVLKMQPTADHYINLSFIYYKLGCYKKCIEAAETALKYDKEMYVAYNNICSSYNNLRQWDKAIEAGEKGLKINPNYELLKNNLEISQKGKASEQLIEH
jgi:protein O-mannosyl-transferase